VRLTVVGCSPAWPNPGGAQSGYLVESGGRSILLDCGPGVLARLRETELWPSVDAIVVSHFHLDHFGDLVPWAWGALYLEGRGDPPPRPELWVHAGGRTMLEHFGGLLGFPDMFDRVFSVFEYAADAEFRAGGCSVAATKVPHYRMDAFAFRVSAEGKALAYSADSGPSRALVEAARGTDLFVCEATLRSGEADGLPRGHLSFDEAVAAFEESGARDLLVTHRPAELGVPEGVAVAHDGLVRDI
jgi:ribonuclease BN (tRNA processing enzyme)